MQGIVLEWACSLIFLKMLKAGPDTVVQWVPLGFVSALYLKAGRLAGGAELHFVFFFQ